MKYLVCDGDWLVDESGLARCSGQLTAMTVQDAGSLGSLTPEERKELQDYTIGVFFAVFCVLALKKHLSTN
ncbi:MULTISPECIES: hypothetical protein [Pseudomonas]|jgi:hypothetical protein|uniref:hypothetical protein n=1 Tax=Pseudomonas TaxID=286 RepID=UPI00178490B6|nr:MULTISPECIES: hypothetical protein [Pseudomonas]QOF84657.1 hypothetical protein IG194_29755 [Pseudomonas sp. ADPe]